jgi:hypothetical protein
MAANCAGRTWELNLNRKIVIRLLIIAAGLGVILLSLFAFQLGLDNDPGWGPRRVQLIAIGLMIILFGCLYWITPQLARVFGWKPIEKIEPSAETTSLKKIDDILLIVFACLVFALYVWIITVGRIDKWPTGGHNYYWKLAQAFQQGQAHLLQEPNPQLATLENPYDHHQREGIEYLWDTTYYDGKYFLYWGPVPAVIAAIVSSVTGAAVPDAYLVFSFVFGTALFSVLLLREICKKFSLPRWAFWGGALALMINVPMIWLLTRPIFYEVSISGGQFFLMMGFYFLFLGFRNVTPHTGWIAASTLSFGLAGATRINLLPSVILLAALILWRIYRLNQKKGSPSMPAFAAALVPLTLVACGLCWYNYDRFGSIFEFGHRYQLTGPSLTANYEDISSVKYILPNTYTYIFRPPALGGEFPFFTVPWVKEKMWPAFIHLPEHYYYTEPVAGILFVVPLLGLTALMLARFFWLFINGDVPRTPQPMDSDSHLFTCFGISLFVYIVIQMFVLLSFVNSAMRYLVDITPALIVLSTMFAGYYVRRWDQNPYLVKIVTSLWILASTLTALAGFLIGFTGDKNNFLNQNPGLYYLLVEWFAR